MRIDRGASSDAVGVVLRTTRTPGTVWMRGDIYSVVLCGKTAAKRGGSCRVDGIDATLCGIHIADGGLSTGAGSGGTVGPKAQGCSGGTCGGGRGGRGGG